MLWLVRFHKLRVYIDWRLIVLLLDPTIMRNHATAATQLLLLHLLALVLHETGIQLCLRLPAISRDVLADLGPVVLRCIR